MHIKKLGQINSISSSDNKREISATPVSSANLGTTNSIGQQQVASNNLTGLDLNFAKKIQSKEETKKKAQENAPNILAKANFIIRDSKNILDEASEKYSQAVETIKFANESFFGRIFDIDENKSIIFTSTQYDNDNPDTMEEFDLDGNLKRTTYFDKNLKPTIIKEYDEKGDKYDEYQFNPRNSEVTVIKGVKQINRTNYSIDRQYSYKDNALEKYEENILYSALTKFSAVSIGYDNKNKNISFTINKKYTNEFENSHQQEYVFMDNKLSIYSENVCASRDLRKNNPGILVSY
ncbi:MAG: hypothetical protein IJ003_03020 [Candidatus Gastranaerophilales bacterium]|nr:hypothetical protein [Candidatus Gastranaerophilales bacterium]